MKTTSIPSLTLAFILGSSLLALQPAFAAGSDMGNMDMSNMDMSHPAQTAGTDAVGVVDEIDAAKGIVTISHEPIKSLGWSAMTMDFVVKDKKMLAKLAKGKKIHFTFIEQKGDYVITKVK